MGLTLDGIPKNMPTGEYEMGAWITRCVVGGMKASEPGAGRECD